MSNRLYIVTERVERPFFVPKSYWQLVISDDYESHTIALNGKRDADRLRKKGAAAIIKRCVNDGENACELIHDHCNNEKGVSVDGDYITPEALIEILREVDDG